MRTEGDQASGTSTTASRPSLRIWPSAGTTSSVVLVLHGGRERSAGRSRPWQLAYRRMVPFARAAHWAAGDSGTAVWLLRNRVRGWNEPRCDAIADADWALTEIQRRHPGASVVLVGHSMGGRVALRLAGTESVRAVCALAPWIKPGEPTDQLRGRTVALAHGDRDTWTDPAASYDYAVRARASGMRICRFEMPGARHAMLRRPRDWSGLVGAFVAGETGARPAAGAITAALDAHGDAGLRAPFPEFGR